MNDVAKQLLGSFVEQIAAFPIVATAIGGLIFMGLVGSIINRGVDQSVRLAKKIRKSGDAFFSAIHDETRPVLQRHPRLVASGFVTLSANLWIMGVFAILEAIVILIGISRVEIERLAFHQVLGAGLLLSTLLVVSTLMFRDSRWARERAEDWWSRRK